MATKKTAAKKARPKRTTVAKKNWTVSINENHWNPSSDPTYFVPASDSRDAIIRAVQRFKADHPTTDISDLSIQRTTGEYHYLPPEDVEGGVPPGMTP